MLITNWINCEGKSYLLNMDNYISVFFFSVLTLTSVNCIFRNKSFYIFYYVDGFFVMVISLNLFVSTVLKTQMFRRIEGMLQGKE